MDPQPGETWRLTSSNGETFDYEVSGVSAGYVACKISGEDFSTALVLWQHLVDNVMLRRLN